MVVTCVSCCVVVVERLVLDCVVDGYWLVEELEVPDCVLLLPEIDGVVVVVDDELPGSVDDEVLEPIGDCWVVLVPGVVDGVVLLEDVPIVPDALPDADVVDEPEVLGLLDVVDELDG